MKRLLTLVASASIAFSCANAAIIFDPANPLNVSNEAGFTGSQTITSDPFTQARLRFTFSNLNPSPLSQSFQITNISLTGPGITGSLNFSGITITANGALNTAYANLTTSLLAANFSGSTVSFSLPGNVINDSASFTVQIRYSSADPLDGNNLNSSFLTYQAQNVAPIPEPGTWAAAALLVGGSAFMRWRRRKVA
jgi:hypothetical protein